MARLPYAAKTLIEQVTAAKPKTTAEAHGDPDGLNVQRTIRFNKATSKWLAPLLDEMQDSRIAEAELTDAGYLHVTFVSGTDADRADQFPIDAAQTVSTGNRQAEPEPETEDAPEE